MGLNFSISAIDWALDNSILEARATMRFSWMTVNERLPFKRKGGRDMGGLVLKRKLCCRHGLLKFFSAQRGMCGETVGPVHKREV